jgi:MFS family permease
MRFGFPSALRHRRFFWLWLGLLLSITGSQMQLWALFWHVRQLSANPLAIGIIGAARFTPIMLFSLLGGVVADRYSRRTILFITQSFSMLIALGLWALTAGGRIQLWQIYLLTAFQAVAMAFDTPARQSLVPNLVPAQDLPSAFSLQSIAFNTGAILGPALSGLVIGYWGQEYTYLLNAISFIAVLLALLGIGRIPQRVQGLGSLRLAWLDMRAGIHFILHQPIILSSMILDFFATFFSSANTLLPYVARDVLHVNEVAYGWLAAAQSIGAVTAGLVFSQLQGVRKQGRLLVLAVLVFGLATIFFGLARTFTTVFLSLVVVGAADSVSTILRNTIRQLLTPDELRGRMTSINQMFFMGGPQLGEVEAGVVAQMFGVPFAILSGGVGCLLATLVIVRIWPQLLRYNGDEPLLATAA